MATAKQLAWRRKFARLYGKKRKAKGISKKRKAALARKAIKRRPKKAFTTYRRYLKKERTAMARRTRRSRRGGSRKRYVSVSLLSIGQLAMQYANLTGKPLGSILDQLTGAILGGQGDIFEILMAEMMGAVKNITDNPFQVAAKGAVIAGFFAIIRSFAGRKKIIGIGKFRITV